MCVNLRLSIFVRVCRCVLSSVLSLRWRVCLCVTFLPLGVPTCGVCVCVLMLTLTHLHVFVRVLVMRHIMHTSAYLKTFPVTLPRFL